ncbi:MAG: ABC transporter substrate-binding protein [Acidimicrobiaceae bacterium]|nr:ABC transporter substrate-binding protein [Acidimicrobiaceae bacterium]
MLLTACSSSTGTHRATGSSGTSSAGNSASAPAGTPIKVGDICSCTGPEASTVGQTTPVMQAWAKWVNSHGGIAGHPVSLEVKDDAYNPSTSVSDVHTMVSQDHVIALFDNSAVDETWAAFVKQQGIPVFGGQTSDQGYSNPDFFPPGATYNHFTDADALAAKKVGAKKMADLYCAEVAVCAESSRSLKKSLTKLGIELSFTTAVPFAAPNYTAACLAAQRSGATVMTIGTASSTLEQIVSDCTKQGYTPTQLNGEGGAAIAWLKIPALENNVDVQPDLPWFVRNAATKPMYEALAAYAPQVLSSPNFGEVAIESWTDGAELQAAGASLGSSPSSAALINGLYKFHGETLGGLAPPLTFARSTPFDNGCFFFMGIKHQKFVTPYGVSPICV